MPIESTHPTYVVNHFRPQRGPSRSDTRRSSRLSFVLLFWGIALVLAGIGSARSSRAASLIVSALGDGAAAGHCQLRDAILAANNDATSGACPAGDGLDTIGFADGLEGEIVLLSALPAIRSDLVIEGPGADRLVVSGGGAHRVFRVHSGIITIRGLTIANGFVDDFGRGAGLAVTGPARLVLEDCRITGNVAYNGGGIAIDAGRARIARCTIDGNQTNGNSGAGIVNGSILHLVDSTVSNNATSGEERAGGGLLVESELPTTTIVQSSTFSGNAAPIGSNVMILAGAVIEIDSTVLANPQGGGNCEGEVLSDGDNLADDDSCGLGEVGDLESVDALLAPLGDNGGPTDTHLPLPGSPLIDGGDSDSCFSTTDQRGSLRPLDGDGDGMAACDIGAVEVLPEPTSAMLLSAGLFVLRALGRFRTRLGSR